ncbi:MAG TPA: hypothetical protein DCF68_09710, partial [Cyanothece sp. UBA12306]|nr:hypothetical protein [Cyanothece sp. UBA12306]
MNISATNLFREIHQDHVKLRRRKEYDNLPPENLANLSKELLEKIRSAGRIITDFSQRQRLESYALYWSRFISEVTHEYPDFSLLEPEESLLQSEEVEEKSAKHQDWGNAPDVSVFFGRTEELDTLEQRIIKERCRLVVILGIGGIGKTQLSVKLGQSVQERFEYVIWRSLLNAPPVTEIIADLIKFLSNQQETETDLADTIKAKISLLIQYLKEHRCLLILDNVETILQGGTRAGQYREGYEGYGQLFKIVGEVFHQSCLLLTSRESVQELERLEGKTKPVRFLELNGLDYLNGKKIFAEIGAFYGSDDEWREMIEFYHGNPLVLELVARHIDEVFFGQISEFLREGKLVFADISNFLDYHFERLSDNEKEIMYWLAINREAVSRSELEEDILSLLAKEQVPSTLQSLQRRLPLQKIAAGFTIQPVIIEYMTNRLIEQACEEIMSGEIELLNSHALLKALAKDYLRESQSRLILKPVTDRAISILRSKKFFEEQLKKILSNLQEKSPLKPGYATGNILNLLCQLKTDLKGYDFSHLTVWQAYLQRANLHKVNFSHSQVEKSVFTGVLGGVVSVAFSPDGRFLATGDLNHEIHLWRLGDSQAISILRGHTHWVWSIAFSPDGKLLASASDDRTVRLWDFETGQLLKTVEGHVDKVRSVAVSPGGKLLASASDDQTIRLWDVKTGNCLKT